MLSPCVKRLLALLGILLVTACTEELPVQPRDGLSPETMHLAANPHNRGYAVGMLEANGGWKYAWDHDRVRYHLRISHPDRQLEDLPCSRGDTVAPRCGGISGGSGFARLFVHIYYMVERSRGSTRTVVVAAWGDEAEFQAAVLPDAPESRVILEQADGLTTGEVAELIQWWVERSDDVIQGSTTRIEF